MSSEPDTPGRDIDELLAAGPTQGEGAAPGRGGKDALKRRLAVLDDFWGHADPGVFAWADAPPATRYAALVRTQRFVEWLIATFDVREIKPCWTLHPAVVAELWALERLHHATHTLAHDDPGAPIGFYNQLGHTRSRLRTDTGMDSCTAGEHQVPVRELPERVLARRATYVLPEQWTAAWAWPSVDSAGESVAVPPHTRGVHR